MKKVIIIPARYQSSRFPGKPLRKILGKEMIIWVAEKCEKALGKKLVYVATDDERIHSKVKKFGFQTISTSKDCLTGTDRVAEASELLNADIYINVQGDEPLIEPEDIKKVIDEKSKYPDHVICGYKEVLRNENPLNKNIPKVVLNENNELIYISRSLVPGSKNENLPNKNNYFKQVCIYAFNKKELRKFYLFGRKSVIEQSEDIEILRFFELNIKVKMVKTISKSLAIDHEDDIKKVENFLKQ